MQVFLIEALNLEPNCIFIIKIVNLSYYYKVLYLILIAEFLAIKTIRPEAK